MYQHVLNSTVSFTRWDVLMQWCCQFWLKPRCCGVLSSLQHGTEPSDCHPHAFSVFNLLKEASYRSARVVIVDWPKWTWNKQTAEEGNKSCDAVHVWFWLGKSLTNCSRCVLCVQLQPMGRLIPIGYIIIGTSPLCDLKPLCVEHVRLHSWFWIQSKLTSKSKTEQTSKQKTYKTQNPP